MAGSQYLKGRTAVDVPQSEPIPGAGMSPNDAGGYGWDVDCWARLRRFLILGNEGGNYYADERDATFKSVTALKEALAEDGARAVELIAEVSEKGRAPHNDEAIFALATAAADDDGTTRGLALRALPRVCRTGTHLFQFIGYVQGQRGWGRQMRKAVSAWYEEMPADKLALQLVKYRQREGVTHADVMRLAHPVPPTHVHASAFGFASGNTEHVRGEREGTDEVATAVAEWTPDASTPALIRGFLEAKDSEGNATELASIIRQYNLPREAVPTDYLTSPEVWEALLEDMPINAMVRNLANMTRIGLIAPGSDACGLVIDRLDDAEAIRRSRIHPLNVLTAMMTYASGHGMRGSNTWEPVGSVIDALDAAFYKAFGNVTPTGKRVLIGIDTSGSMSGTWSGTVGRVPNLTPAMAACAMALVWVATEDNVEVVGFDTSVRSLPITARQRLDDAVRVGGWAGGGTDCSLPMQYALNHSRDVDAFLLLTDGQTWAGRVHPSEQLRQYRRMRSIPQARLVQVAMVANGTTIGDPKDPGTMDVVGFDTATPELVAGFIGGEF